MIIFILCGGIGSRMEDYSFPKPLNMIHGKPSISYCLQNLPEEINVIHFIVAPHLVKYNFEEIIKNEFKSRQCIFHNLPYFTRGAIESAYIGIKDLESQDENIVFLDNDVLHKFPIDFFVEKNGPFIGYSIDNTNNAKYSYVKLDAANHVIEFKEKQRISNNFCCGVYGFKNTKQFKELAIKRLFLNNSTELYMSLLFQDLLSSNNLLSGYSSNASIFEYDVLPNVPILGVFFEDKILHIGSLNELKQGWDFITKPKMRVCFDLDNTLVSYPTIPNNYNTVKPNEPMIRLARKMHSEGHTIIIHTARRMKTHNNNMGAAIKDIGMYTFNTLEEFGIPYDELIFGKPIADMYIDDRSVNPYRGDLKCMGYIGIEDVDKPLNSLNPNKYNSIEVLGGKVVKRGPTKFIEGEIYYYNNIPKCYVLSKYFPIYYESAFDGDFGTIIMEHIRGIPAYALYSMGVMTKNIMSKMFEFMDTLHFLKNESIKVNVEPESVISNYTDKLISRFAIKSDYPFEDAEIIQRHCFDGLQKYISKNELEIVDYIHGDLWFSNIIVQFNGEIKAFDMRGKMNDGLFTTGGDKLYDYAKMYQSVLGYDCILNDKPIPENHGELREFFETELIRRNICVEDLRSITFSLVIGTLHFIESLHTKNLVWEWIKHEFYLPE